MTHTCVPFSSTRCIIILLIGMLIVSSNARAEAASLASWNDGPAKQSIISFVDAVTDSRSATYVAPEDRIATFDQDGTLWIEHPYFVEAMFALDRVRTLAPTHPEWTRKAPFKAVIDDDKAAIASFNEAEWKAIFAASHAGMSTAAFRDIVNQWLASARHPRFRRPYTELVYRPMRELMDYLRENGFRIYLVTEGDQEFVRAYSERVYDIPPERVLGSSVLTRYKYIDGRPILMREPQPFFIDDHANKAVAINLFIGKQPLAAVGNSDYDREMLEWTQAGGGSRLMMLIFHDDGDREYSYGPARELPNTNVGPFADWLMAEATENRWTVVSMKHDWKEIFAFETPSAPAVITNRDDNSTGVNGLANH
jgi:hypothetical protein